MSDKPVMRITRGDIDIEALRERMPHLDIIDDRPTGRWPFDLLLGWVWLFGVWPFSHPEHDLATVMSAVDIALHLGAFLWLNARWQLVRR